MTTLRRFAFFEREALRAPALACLDITAGTSGRGLIVLGDGEGHVVLVGRDFSGRAFRAHKNRVNAVALLKGTDILVTLGDGADARPPSVRTASRAAALAARDKLRRDRDREVVSGAIAKDAAAGAKEGKKPGKPAAGAGRKGRADSADADGSDRDSDGEGPSGPEPDADLGYVLGLGVPLEHGVGPSSLAGGGSVGPAADDPAYATATLKVWRLDRRDPRTGAPECARTVRVFTPASKQPEKAVTSLAVNEELTQVAVGCTDGTLLLMRSDWTRERGSAAGVKYQLLQEPTHAAPAPSGKDNSRGADRDASSASGSAPSFPNVTSPDAVTFLAFSVYHDPLAGAGAGAQEEGAGADSGTPAPDSAPAASASSGLLGGVGRSAAAAAARTRGLALGGAASTTVTGGGAAAASGPSSSSSGPSSGAMLVLFHVSPSRVRSWFTTEARPPGLGRGWGPSECSILLDEQGGAAGCACVSEGGELVVGGEGGVFLYSPEDRKAAYPFPGRKSRVMTFRSHHLVVATEDEPAMITGGGMGAAGGGAGSTLRGGGATAPGGGVSSSSAIGGAAVPGRLTLTVYDLRCKFIAFQMSLAPPPPPPGALGGRGGPPGGLFSGAQIARLLLSEWGLVFALVGTLQPGAGPDGLGGALGGITASSAGASSSSSSSAGLGLSVYQLSEKDTGSKVDTLCSLQLYDVAAAVASSSNFGSGDGLRDIYRKHGDHLFAQGDWEGAVGQYVRTLGHLEPSYVIRRFLDAARVPHLATYLQALHASGRASADHTTLLLYCFTKLRASGKLRAFVRGELGAGAGASSAHAASGGEGAGSLPSGGAPVAFDVRTVISVLRDLSSIDPECTAQALYLAEAHGEHDRVVGLLLDMADAAAGAAVTHAAAAAAAAAEGAELPASSSSPPPPGSSGSYVDAALSYVRRLPFAEAEAYGRRYGRSLMRHRPEPTTDLLVDLCAGYTPTPGPAGSATAASSSSAGQQQGGCEGSVGAARPRTRCESPEGFIPLFVDHPGCLKRFAWALAGRAASRTIPQLSRTMWHSLLEVALTTQQAQTPQDAGAAPAPAPSASASSSSGPFIDVLGGILREPSADYDPHYALLLCQRSGHKAGALYLFERLRRYPTVLQHFAETADVARAAGRLPEAKAARRELLRKAKAFSDPALALSGEPDPGPTIWTAVLRYLARTYSPPGQAGAARPGPDGGPPLPPLDDSEALLSDALRHVERTGVLPPLGVVQLLGSPPGAVPFGLVRDYLIRGLSGDRERAGEDARVVDSLRGDAVAMLNEAHRLATQPVVFQSRRCRACGGELDLPSVHFTCGGLAGEEHSFHAHCVSDNAALLAAAATGGGGGGEEEEEAMSSLACPLCAGEQRQVREFRASLGTQGGRTSEQFFAELASSADGFAKVSETFAKGVFAPPPAPAAAGGASDY